jgi:AcrR family transcriptional regulator
MGSHTTAPSRRERLRAQTLAEIREHGLAQIAEGGPRALSLIGIAKAMGMSGPALYRYFASRDDLLMALAEQSWADIADTLTEEAKQAPTATPEERLRAALNGTRQWALRQPHLYRLVFGSYGSGKLGTDRIIPPAQRTMEIVLAALSELGPAERAAAVSDSELRREVVDWGNGSEDSPHDPRVLFLGLLAAVRIHGIISLEIEGFFEQVGVDPARLYEAEIDHLVEQRTGQLRLPLTESDPSEPGDSADGRISQKTAAPSGVRGLPTW